MLRTFFLLVAFCAALPLIGQDDAEKARLTILKAQEALLGHQYEKAGRLYQKALDLDAKNPKALRGFAVCMALTAQYEAASIHYDSLLSQHPWYSRVAYFEAGKAHFHAGHYDQALELYYQFEQKQELAPARFGYLGETELSDEENHLANLSAHIHACFVAADSLQFYRIEAVENLGPAVNTPADEYFPYLTNDQELLFFTSRTDRFSDEDLYYSQFTHAAWQESQPVSMPFNSRQNEGMATLVRNGRKVFFTACNRSGVLGLCDIWEAEVEGHTLKKGNSLKGAVNTPHWESQASVSCDGSRLYFASDRAGGQGGSDIWMSQMSEDGTWGPAQNLGPVINTPGDEEAPFITLDGATLYFSSTGHPGLGEQDIFRSRLEEKGWGRPLNLGPPVNSSYRELGFFLSADGGNGYFASDREKGYGGMDIYRFELPSELYSRPITLVEGQVLDSFTRQPIATTLFLDKKRISTDAEGRFFLCLPADSLFHFSVLEADYEAHFQQHTIPLWDNNLFYAITVPLVPLHPPKEKDLIEPATRNPTRELKHSIYFEFGKADLNVENHQDLAYFIEKILVRNDVLEVEIIGFTDQIGSSKYNLLLSEQRAKNVAIFLKDRGIRVDRVYIEGGGEIESNIPDREKRKVEVIFVMQGNG